nr:MAG TPA: hypothetical protein [Caudoviricetes sp.]
MTLTLTQYIVLTIKKLLNTLKSVIKNIPQ